MRDQLKKYLEQIRDRYQQYCNGVPVHLPADKVEQFKKSYAFVNGQHEQRTREEMVSYLKDLEDDFKPDAGRSRRLYRQRQLDVLSGKTGPRILTALTDEDAKEIRVWIVRELRRARKGLKKLKPTKKRERDPSEEELIFTNWAKLNQIDLKETLDTIYLKVETAFENGEIPKRIGRSTLHNYLKKYRKIGLR